MKPSLETKLALARAIARALQTSSETRTWEAEAGQYTDKDGDTWVFVNVLDPDSDEGSYQVRLDLEVIGWIDNTGYFSDEKPEPPPNFTPEEMSQYEEYFNGPDYEEDDPYPEFPNGEFGNEETRYSRLPSDPRELREIDEWGREHCDNYPF